MNIETRVSALEKVTGGQGYLILFVGDAGPTQRQQETIAEAEKRGQQILLFDPLLRGVIWKIDTNDFPGN